MKLSEELVWRGFKAQNTFTDISELDKGARKFYLGADPSADSLTIGNLAALMMVYCFVRHGYEPFMLVGGATGQIGDPKDNEERQLKALEEVEYNKGKIAEQFRRIIRADFTLVDNYDWFKDIGYLEFLRLVGKQFSMTQLLDREFVKARIGEGKSGVSYAEFSYSLIQGYDFLHLYREYGVDLQLCGADQYGNCVSGVHLIKRLGDEGARADVWSTPLVIDKVSGRKFGKSEGNAIWLAEEKTSVFDFYQFWVGLADEGIDYYMKIYTLLGREELEAVIAEHMKDPSKRVAQKTLAYEVTKVVHGEEKAEMARKITEVLFGGGDVSELGGAELELLAESLPVVKSGQMVTDVLVESGEVKSKGEARRLISGGAIEVNNEKITDDMELTGVSLVKKGKNKFVLVR
ncbi:tyrosine--tRNA ligase [Candidatus Saccharibacteria bacterium]|nr:tyrosine--tRNA ligase [Candidatus Saccharibacteria bacterium]